MDLTTTLMQNGNKDDPRQPWYHGTREIFGLKDLVVSFKTTPCLYHCNFCGLPRYSGEITTEDIKAQIDYVFSQNLKGLKRLTLRNEGSMLNPRQFPEEAFSHLGYNLAEFLPRLKLLSLEARIEDVTEEKIVRLQRETGYVGLDLTVGFETQDERILNQVLGKRTSKGMFGSKAVILGHLGVNLTAYVMLKPDPRMSEEEGIKEALASVDYLHSLSIRHDLSLIIYVNPTYAAPGTKLAEEMIQVGYKPPTKRSLVKVIAEAKRRKIKVYTDEEV